MAEITIKEQINNYVQEIQQASDNEWKALNYDPNNKPSFSYTFGPKYAKILYVYSGQTSVHCFVDYEGNIYKVATWRTPAKGIRGHILNPIKPLLSIDFYRR